MRCRPKMVQTTRAALTPRTRDRPMNFIVFYAPALPPQAWERPLRAQISATMTWGFFVRALRSVRRIDASAKPAARNSSRKATPSFAPAIQANQLLSRRHSCNGRGLSRISSAA